MRARALSDGERAILAEEAEDAAPDYRELAHRQRVVRRGRGCTMCRMTMPPGTPYTETVAIVDGTFEIVVSCRGVCPQDDEICVACGGHPVVEHHWEDEETGQERSQTETCTHCQGRGLVPKGWKRRDLRDAPLVGPGEVPF
jgi:hypothetical protein